jgi:Secretion system C-terminal sorting domain
MVKNLFILISATAIAAFAAHSRAAAQSSTPRPVSQYMAVAWETNGYLVTENWGKSWRLVSSDAISELPERLVQLLKANQAGKEAAHAAVLPNPTTGPVAIRFGADRAGSVRITLHDTRGAEVHRSTREVATGFQTETIDLSSLPNGVYYYRVLNDGGSIGSGAITVAR